jgi:hypothetical protein
MNDSSLVDSSSLSISASLPSTSSSPEASPRAAAAPPLVATPSADLAAARRAFVEQGRFVHLPEFVPAPLLERVGHEAAALRARAQRKVVPGYKKSGSVSYHRVLEEAPAIVALYRSPRVIDWLSRLAGAPLVCCPESDPHACALYYYTEPGDHIGFHFDSSHYAGARYTALIGIVDDSSARLVCDLHKRDRTRAPERREIATAPGSIVFFDGDQLWHSVSPVGPGETRVVLSLEYVTDPSMSPLRRLVSDMKDAMTYFGFAEILRARFRAKPER